MQYYQLHQEKMKYFILIGTIFLLTINMCDRGRTITHLQISRFHTQVWYNITDMHTHAVISVYISMPERQTDFKNPCHKVGQDSLPLF